MPRPAPVTTALLIGAKPSKRGRGASRSVEISLWPVRRRPTQHGRPQDQPETSTPQAQAAPRTLAPAAAVDLARAAEPVRAGPVAPRRERPGPRRARRTARLRLLFRLGRRPRGPRPLRGPSVLLRGRRHADPAGPRRGGRRADHAARARSARAPPTARGRDPDVGADARLRRRHARTGAGPARPARAVRPGSVHGPGRPDRRDALLGCLLALL